MYRVSTVPLLGFFCLAAGLSPAFAQTEPLQIDGPQTARPGQLVRLVANTGPAETPFWIVLQPITLDYEQADGGRKLIFATGCQSDQTVTVLLLAQRVTNNRIVTRQIRKTIKIQRKDSDPPKNPPGETPTQPGPDDWTSSPLYRSTMVAWPNIRTDAGKALSPDVAGNFDRVARQIEQGQIVEAAEIWTTLSAANRATLKLETTAWQAVAESVQAQFQRLQLTNVREHAFHLRAAAAAIRNSHSQATTPRSSR